MDTLEKINTVLSGEEIEPNGVYDTRFRQAHTADFPKFRGLPGQVTVNPDERHHMSIWQGTDLGDKEDVPFISDLQSSELNVSFKTINSGLIKENVSSERYTINPNVSQNYYLNLTVKKVLFDLMEPELQGNCSIQIYLTNTVAPDTIEFPSKVSWLGAAPQFNSNIGETNIIKLTYNGSSWFAYFIDSTINDRVVLRAVDEAIVSNARLLGWVLPTGSADGEIADKYALRTSIVDISDEDLNNIARVSSAIYDVIDVSHGLDSIHKIEDSLGDINIAATNIENIIAVAPHTYTLAWIKLHTDLLDTLLQHQDMLSVASENLDTFKLAVEKLETYESLNSIKEDIVSLNLVKQEVVGLSTIVADISATATAIEGISALATRLEALDTLSSNVNTLNNINDNLSAINIVGGSISTIEDVQAKLPELVNIVSNMDNIKEIGQYVNKGLMLRTVYKDSLEEEYDSTDLNKLYVLPASITNTI